jgi:hypothetical protein
LASDRHTGARIASAIRAFVFQGNSGGLRIVEGARRPTMATQPSPDIPTPIDDPVPTPTDPIPPQPSDPAID